MKKFLSLLVVLSSLLSAQSTNSQLTGSLINDTKFALNMLADSNKSFNLSFSEVKKKPLLAGLLSFAIPGAGQVYTEDYLMAGIFAAVEISAIVLAVTYEGKGDDQTDFFENYANSHWSVERYAKWTINNFKELGSEDFNVFNNEGKVNWSELNKLEDHIGGYYSHKLAPFDDQQYYEMIGKYPQFNVGWEEFGDDINKPFSYGMPLVDQFSYYSSERGKANDYYNVSKWAVIAVVSNHFISALEAAWSASRFNKTVKFNISIEEETIGFIKDYYPKLNLSYNF